MYRIQFLIYMPPRKLQIELNMCKYIYDRQFSGLSSMLQKFFLHTFNTFMVHVYIYTVYILQLPVCRLRFTCILFAAFCVGQNEDSYKALQCLTMFDQYSSTVIHV